MAGPVTDPLAHALPERYHELFASPELLVPVEEIAEDLLGLLVDEAEGLDVSGLLLPAERRIVVNGSEPTPRRRFTLAHELRHCVYKVQEGQAALVYCRATDVCPQTPTARWSGKRTSSPRCS